jgi:hypothetical protein
MNKYKINIQTSDLVALIALLVSIASIYFSVFYKDHDLTVSMIDSKVEYSGTDLTVKLLFHNQGNTYATIIQHYLVFYQSDDWENEGIIFENGKIVYNLDYNPTILVPGEQCLRTIITETDFNLVDSIKSNLKLNQKINIGLVITYINSSGLRTSEKFNIGYIKLNKNKQIEKYNIDYDIFKLNSWSYYSSARLE